MGGPHTSRVYPNFCGRASSSNPAQAPPSMVMEMSVLMDAACTVWDSHAPSSTAAALLHGSRPLLNCRVRQGRAEASGWCWSWGAAQTASLHARLRLAAQLLVLKASVGRHGCNEVPCWTCLAPVLEGCSSPHFVFGAPLFAALRVAPAWNPSCGCVLGPSFCSCAVALASQSALPLARRRCCAARPDQPGPGPTAWQAS